MPELIKTTLPDFPDWFEQRLVEQLVEIKFDSIEASMLSYIKLWGLVESFTKIIMKLYEKRCHLKELKPIIQNIAEARVKLDVYSGQLDEHIRQYSQSISANQAITLNDDITSLGIKLKRHEVSKFSTEAKDLAPQKLPNKEDFEKASNSLNVKLNLVAELLKPKAGKSRYYDTRNLIAHEGKLDLQPENFYRIRIEPLMNAINEIKLLVETESK
jgi:hypothetical protein